MAKRNDDLRDAWFFACGMIIAGDLGALFVPWWAIVAYGFVVLIVTGARFAWRTRKTKARVHAHDASNSR